MKTPLQIAREQQRLAPREDSVAPQVPHQSPLERALQCVDQALDTLRGSRENADALRDFAAWLTQRAEDAVAAITADVGAEVTES